MAWVKEPADTESTQAAMQIRQIRDAYFQVTGASGRVFEVLLTPTTLAPTPAIGRVGQDITPPGRVTPIGTISLKRASTWKAGSNRNTPSKVPPARWNGAIPLTSRSASSASSAAPAVWIHDNAAA